MATVFLCEDERLGRQVAVKRLHPYGSADDVATRFEREARLGASLNHPGLVAVFDTVPDEDGDLIVMEYVPGETLGQALKRGPLSSQRTSAAIAAVAAALDHAHSHGVLHRDIKPGNILLREDGVVKLADLGIATAAEQTRITQSGTLLGTAAYMAPEQLEGGEAERRSDVYALATVAFEALGGRRARLGATPLEVAHQIAGEPTPDLRDAWPDAPAAAAEALARGMARHPDDRQGSAGELAMELERALDPPPHLLPAPAPCPRRSQSARAGCRSPPWRARCSPRRLLSSRSVGETETTSPTTVPASRRRRRSRSPLRARARAQLRRRPSRRVLPHRSRSRSRLAPGGGESGATLNAEGFELMQQGRYEEAIPILERAVAAFPEGTERARLRVCALQPRPLVAPGRPFRGGDPDPRAPPADPQSEGHRQAGVGGCP